MRQIPKDATFEWLQEYLWDLLVERVVQNAPHSRVLWDEMAAHALDLEVRWSRVAGDHGRPALPAVFGGRDDGAQGGRGPVGRVLSTGALMTHPQVGN